MIAWLTRIFGPAHLELVEEDLSSRLDSVLEVIYLLFNEGYNAHAGEGLIRQFLRRGSAHRPGTASW